MNSATVNRKIIPCIWISFIIISLFFSVNYIGKKDLRTGEQWEQYYSIITNEALPVENLLHLEELPFISYGRSRVAYNNISGMETLPLKDVRSRFSSLDPRLDPYMEKSAFLFSAFSGQVESQIIYVDKNSISIWSLYITLFTGLKGRDLFWTISGFNISTFLIPLILYTLYFSGFMILSRKKWWRKVPALAGWFPFIFLNGLPALSAAVFFTYLACRRKVSLFMITAIFLTLIYASASISFTGEFLLLLITGLFSTALLYWEKSAGKVLTGNPSIPLRKWKPRKYYFRKPEHDLFSPVPIMSSIPMNTSGRSEPPGKKDYIPLKFFSGVIAVTVVLFITLETEPESFTVPLAVEQPDSVWTLSGTAATDIEGVLVSPSDYITHLAFQEGFMFGAEWTYPLVEKPLLYPYFISEENSFSKNYEIKAEYSEKWFKDRISVLKNDNPAKLFFSTEHPCFVIKKSNHDNYQSFMLLKFSFSMLLLLLLIFSDGNKYQNKSFSVRKKLLRRNEQVA